ncbi:MAG: hypothetical protein HQL20_04175 [Candidatus Omnitrophica bacterium]|nr:hypothetical protein [Candidatus Omnitrophota bacterium]
MAKRTLRSQGAFDPDRFIARSGFDRLRFARLVLGWLFLFQAFCPPGLAGAAGVPALTLPAVTLAGGVKPFEPCRLKGLRIHQDNAFRLDFLIDTGSSTAPNDINEEKISRQVRYFMAALTMPQREQWVNLSPYEQERIMPEAFSLTEMGRDLLEQDYLLKKITASLHDPKSEAGKIFWQKVYARVFDKYGTTDIPLDTFNKVWIVPDLAVVEEKGFVAVIKESHLKVLLETDYVKLGLGGAVNHPEENIADLTPGIVRDVAREVLIPMIEEEVNRGAAFALLRQVYSSMILAVWYKEVMLQRLLGRDYVDRQKVSGIDQVEPEAKQAIYERYIELFKKGVVNMVQEEYDPFTSEMIPRKYFSGGFDPSQMSLKRIAASALSLGLVGAALVARFDLSSQKSGQSGPAAKPASVASVTNMPAMTPEQERQVEVFHDELLKMQGDVRAIDWGRDIILRPGVAPQYKVIAFKMLCAVILSQSESISGVGGKMLGPIEALDDSISRQALARVMDILARNDPLLYEHATEHVVYVMQYLHDNNPALLRSFFEKIELKNVVHLIAKGNGLYAMDFRTTYKLYHDSLQKWTRLNGTRTLGVEEFLNSVGLQGMDMVPFVANLAAYGYLDDLISDSPLVFVKALPGLCSKANEKSFILAAPALQKMLRTERDGRIKGILWQVYARLGTNVPEALKQFMRLNADVFFAGAPVKERTGPLAEIQAGVSQAELDSFQKVPYWQIVNKGVINVGVAFQESSLAYIELLKKQMIAQGFSVTPGKKKQQFEARWKGKMYSLRVIVGNVDTIVDSERAGVSFGVVSARGHSTEIKDTMEALFGLKNERVFVGAPGSCASRKVLYDLLHSYPNSQWIVRSGPDNGNDANYLLAGTSKRKGVLQALADGVPTWKAASEQYLPQNRFSSYTDPVAYLTSQANSKAPLPRLLTANNYPSDHGQLTPGGIDLNPATLALQRQGNLNSAEISPAMDNAMNVESLYPVMVEMYPLGAQSFGQNP